MNTNNINRLQGAQVLSGVEAKDAAEESHQEAIVEQKEYIDETHKADLAEVEHSKDAREAEQKGTLLGTIFGGPLVGTLIGKAIGNGVGDSDKDQALRDKTDSQMADLNRSKAEDSMHDAKTQMDSAKDQLDAVNKFNSELRSLEWGSASDV